MLAFKRYGVHGYATTIIFGPTKTHLESFCLLGPHRSSLGGLWNGLWVVGFLAPFLLNICTPQLRL